MSGLASVMKVAALQASLASVDSEDGFALIRRRMEQCKDEGRDILAIHFATDRYLPDEPVNGRTLSGVTRRADARLWLRR